MAQKAYKRLVLFFLLALGSAVSGNFAAASEQAMVAPRRVLTYVGVVSLQLISAEVLKSVDKSLGDGSRCDMGSNDFYQPACFSWLVRCISALVAIFGMYLTSWCPLLTPAGTGVPYWLPPNRSLSATGLQVS
jgi:hypothetical protein